jgi:hypothetical protein
MGAESEKAAEEMLAHVERALKALETIRLDGKNDAGVVMHRKIRNLPLKVARE